MIAGAVNARREAVVPLRVRGPSGIEVDQQIRDDECKRRSNSAALGG